MKTIFSTAISLVFADFLAMIPAFSGCANNAMMLDACAVPACGGDWQ